LYGPGQANEHIDPHLVAGFGDPAELEPARRPDGSLDVRRLAGLLAQPLAALNGANYGKPVWHCPLRAAPGDRVLSDAEWARVAAHVMDRTGLAPVGDELGVRWVAVRHAADHIHLVATLARQDRVRPSVWNDFYKVRQACRPLVTHSGLSWAIWQAGRPANACDSSSRGTTSASHRRFQKQAFISRSNSARFHAVRRPATGP
jgi:hypothetical protein